MSPKVLVAGVGNIFFGDDGFGVEVAGELRNAALPRGVEVVDFGIRGVHLAYQLLDGYDALVLVDAVCRGDEAGTLSVIEPEPESIDDGAAVDAHGMDPGSVLRLLGNLGGSVPRVVVVGCEAGHVAEEMGLSAPVADAVLRAAGLVRDVVHRLVSDIATAELDTGAGSGASRPVATKEEIT